MLFVVRFTDKPGSLAPRNSLLAEHLRWLDKRRDRILIAGSLRTENSETPVGAYWIVEAERAADVEVMFQTDPFWTVELRASFEILRWSKAFPERTILI